MFLLQTKGGNMALGILGAMTGALGAGLAGGINSQLVAAKSAEMASGLSGKGSIDLEPRIKEKISQKATFPLSGASPFSVAGALLINVGADNNVRTALIINATDTSLQVGWSKSYFYHFSTIVSSQELENGGYQQLLNKIALDLDRAIDTTTSVLVDDLSGKLGTGTPMKINSDFLRPLGNAIFHFQALKLMDRDDLAVFRIDGKPGVILFPTIDGVHLFQRGQFSLEM